MNQLDSLHAAGLLRSAGVVVEVGRGAEEFKVGQMVACAGNDFALHAEVNWVPAQPVRAGARRAWSPGSRRSPPSGPSPCTACVGPRRNWRHGVRHRARPGRPDWPCS